MEHWILSNRASLPLFLPELILIAGAMVSILLGAFRENPRKFSLAVGGVTLTLFLGSVIHLFSAYDLNEGLPGTGLSSMSLFSEMMVLDFFALFFKGFAGCSSLILLYFLASSAELKKDRLAEMVSFLLAITLGLSLMAAAKDLLLIYLSIELVSILSYVLVGFQPKNRVSSEAGLKYVLYGGLATGFMVFAFSILYGLVGSTDLVEIGKNVASMGSHPSGGLILFALIGIFAGMGYKIAAVPTHMWCPDVYHGAPLPITAFLSVAPKAAGFALLMRFLILFFGVSDEGTSPLLAQINWPLWLAIISALTMTVGNFAALRQTNLKRLMAYSSIAHAGYLLMGVCTFNQEGLSALLFYLVTYFLMNFGAFLIIQLVSNQEQTEELEGYRGLGWRSPFLAWTFTIFLFSLVGLPPFAGFLGKLILFAAVIHEGLYWLAIVAVVNTVVSLFYYVRIVRTMFFETPFRQEKIRIGAGAAAVAMLLAAPTVALVVYWGPILKLAEISTSSLF